MAVNFGKIHFQLSIKVNLGFITIFNLTISSVTNLPVAIYDGNMPRRHQSWGI